MKLNKDYIFNLFSKSILKFGITGIISNLINFVVYFFSLFFISLNFSVFFGYVAGFIFSYYGNKNWTFKYKNKDKSLLNIEKFQYVLLHLFSLILMIYLVNFFNKFNNLNYSFSWILSAIPVACINYLISKKIFS